MLYGQQTYTVTEIAMACGFSTTSYFIQIFKNKYGMTPKQMQKMLVYNIKNSSKGY